jgi:hypothetical protein
MNIELIARAILRGDSIYKYNSNPKGNIYIYKEIILPTGQKAGTETQKQTYARLKASEIINQLNKED